MKNYKQLENVAIITDTFAKHPLINDVGVFYNDNEGYIGYLQTIVTVAEVLTTAENDFSGDMYEYKDWYELTERFVDDIINLAIKNNEIPDFKQVLINVTRLA